jgi:hypothetical protein
MYLICDNVYLRWPTSIYLYSKADVSTVEGYFLTNLESMQKDVGYTFEIIKKRRWVLNHGFKHRDILICEKIFVTCCCLHNFMLDLMGRNNVKIGCGYPIGLNKVWLDRHTAELPTNTIERHLTMQFGHRRLVLAKHLCVF